MFLSDILHIKSPISRVKYIGRQLRFQKPDARLICLSPLSFRSCYSNCCDSIPEFGSPYMPLQIFIYMYPSFVVLAVSLYCFMKYLVRSLSFRRIYSLCFMGVLRFKTFMSKVIYLDPGMDIALFSTSFTVRRVTVGVLLSPG